MKVLYVCPFAHYSGHHPHVATVEPEQLNNARVDVTLLTFSGIINGAKPNVRSIQTIGRHNKIEKILKEVRKRTLPRWILMFFETYLTLANAVNIYRKEKYDVIHLRDGEPFLFISHLVSLPYKNINWFVSLTAAIVFKPKLKLSDLIHRPFVCIYTTALHFWINNILWKPFYQFSLSRNNHIYSPQNAIATEKYKQYMGGIFNVKCIEIGTDNHVVLPEKKLAREYLKLPQEKFILLSFGAPNAGKDMESIFKAVQKTGDVFLVHGGTHTFSLGSSPIELAKKYDIEDKSKIFNYFIPEEEKKYFFAAADAIILSYKKSFASTSSMMWEAARYKLPSIASNANSLGKDIEKYQIGILFGAENPNSLVHAIYIYKILSPGKINQMKENCSKFVSEHSYSKWANECISAYEVH